MTKDHYPMNSHILATLAVATSALLVTACGQSSAPEADSKAQPAAAAPVTQPVPAQAAATTGQVPSGAAPDANAPVFAAVAPQAPAPLAKSDQLVIQGFAAPVPGAWSRTQPSSTMRVAQFALPAAPSAEAGELVAFFFPKGQGGSQQANIERWASQFTSADGKPVAPKISNSKEGDTEVTLVELRGTYARGVGMGPTGDAKPDQTLMTALVETSIGRITLQMYGPSMTIAAQRDPFLKLAKGFRPA